MVKAQGNGSTKDSRRMEKSAKKAQIKFQKDCHKIRLLKHAWDPEEMIWEEDWKEDAICCNP